MNLVFIQANPFRSHSSPLLTLKTIANGNVFNYLGKEMIAEILLRNGANVNAEKINKLTPLHLTAQFGIF